MPRIMREKFKTYGGVFDNFTLRVLERLRAQGHFDELKSPISQGKESQVYSAIKNGELIAVKIYRLETCDFNRMYDYIKNDPRYNALSKVKRQVIFSWVQREFRNIHKAREAGVNVPLPLTYKFNVMLEKFIGDKDPAPQLKDVEGIDWSECLREITKDLKRLYNSGLVHGDLSAFNILYHNGPVFIDFSQGTVRGDPRFIELLERDVRTLIPFFAKKGVDASGVLEEIKNV